MARGWESKDVESQVASRENMAAPGKARKAQDQLEKDRERANIETLSRIHIINDLETATHPNHRKQLEAALAHPRYKLAAKVEKFEFHLKVLQNQLEFFSNALFYRGILF
jgi:hypothetical protein